MSDSDSITIRPYRADDERELVPLFLRAFGRPVTEDHWRWKLKHAGSPVDNVWLAMSAEQPVFQYAGIPARFSMFQSPANMMVSVDTMTAPEFRRRGLLTKVAGKVYAAWRDDGVAFVIGLPNNQWGSRAGALGWEPLFPLQWLIRPLRPEALLARRLNIPLLERATFPGRLWNLFLKGRARRDPHVRTEQVRNADDSFDRIWDTCRSDWAFSTVRDRDWVHWRFLSVPERSYEVTLARKAGTPSGYCAFRLIKAGERTVAHLADLFAGRADYASRDTLLCDLIEKLQEARAESVFALAVPGTPHFQWLRRAGFIPRHSFSVQVVPLSAALPLARMREPQLWNLSGADFDVV